MMEGESHSVVSNSLWLHGLYTPWSSPGQHTGVGSLSFLQGIFPTQGLNPGLPHCRWILYQLIYKGSPRILGWVAYPFSRGSSWPRDQTGVFCTAGDSGAVAGLGRSPGEGIGYPLQYSWASLVAQLVQNPPAVWETWVQSLGWEDPLKKGKATHSSILAWRIPWTV